MKFLYKIPRNLLSIVVTAAVLYLTLSPNIEAGSGLFSFTGDDKDVPELMIFPVAFCYYLDFGRSEKYSNRQALLFICFGLSLALGCLTEELQTMMKFGRTGDIYDLLADCAGIVVGLLTARMLLFKDDKNT